VPEAVLSADGRDVLGMTGSVRALPERRSGDIEFDAEPGSDIEPCRDGVSLPLTVLVEDRDSRRGRYAGVNTPAKGSSVSFVGVGGVRGGFSEGARNPSLSLVADSPGVGGR